MRQKKAIITGIAVVIAIAVLYHFLVEAVDVRFAEKITLKYHHVNKNIELEIIDPNDINELKNICNGTVIKDGELPSCGFASCELIFEGQGKIISVFPACDGCDTMRYTTEDLYYCIGKDNRQKLVEILKKYGATFPCV